MIKRRGQLFPTNECVTRWVEGIPHANIGVAKLTYIKLDAKDPVIPLTVQAPGNELTLSLKVRRAANTLTKTGKVNKTESSTIISALRSQNLPPLNSRLQYRYLDEIKKLRRRYAVVRMGNQENREIIALTDPLVLRWDTARGGRDQDSGDNPEELSTGIDIGRWWIGVCMYEYDHWEVYLKPYLVPSTWYFAETERDISYHPHLPNIFKGHDIWAPLCMGDSAVDIRRWLIRGDIERAFLKIVEQTCSYNKHGAFFTLIQYITQKCPHCFSRLSDDSTCSSCQKRCTNCFGLVWTDYYPRCDTCKGVVSRCPKCRTERRCVVCGRYTCQVCVLNCGQVCATCPPQNLSLLGIFNVPSQRSKGSYLPISMEQIDVLGTPSEPSRSVGDGPLF